MTSNELVTTYRVHLKRSLKDNFLPWLIFVNDDLISCAQTRTGAKFVAWRYIRRVERSSKRGSTTTESYEVTK